MQKVRFLLLQIRDPDDPMRPQEVTAFARAIGCEQEHVVPFDLLTKALSKGTLREVDAILVGGSGNYSAAANNPWLEETLYGLRLIHEMKVPTFASCWGFQAFSRALGGRCIHDPPYAELGTTRLHLTEAGRDDPLFGDLGAPFYGQSGHEDHVVELPPGAVLLASSDLVANQACRFSDAPLYGTQFHPELDRTAFMQRVVAYPQYVERIAGKSIEQFSKSCEDTPETRQLLQRFATLVAALTA